MMESWLMALAIASSGTPTSDGPGDVTAVSVLPGPGRALVVVDVSGAGNVNDFTLNNPARVVLDVEGARLAVPGAVYDGVTRGGITHIRYAQFRPDVVRIVIELESLRDYRLEYGDDGIRVAISTDQRFTAWSSGAYGFADVGAMDPTPPARQYEPALPPLALQRSQQDRITVTWDSASVGDVMAAFAEFSGRSIVLGAEVSARVTAEIKDQPWDIALKEILDAYGFVAEEVPESGLIRIQNPQVIAARDSLEPKTTLVIPVNFKRSADIANVLTSMLGSRGSVVADTGTNQLIITDIVSRIDEDTALIRQLDIPTPQVSIKAKLIFVDRTDIEELGVRYDLGSNEQFFNRLVQRPDPSTLVGVDTDGDGVNDALVAQSAFPSTVDVIDLGGNSVSAIGNASQQLPNSALELIFSTAIGNFALTSFVEALQQVELADLQAEPVITTSDNTSARVLVGERTPIRVIDAAAQQGGQGQAPIATIRFEETGIELGVTPHVTNTGQVLMRLTTENSSIRAAPTDVGFTLQTQNTENEILVNDGETMVIGGLTVTQVTVAKSGIPFLVDLPILGRIFGFTSRRETRRDLLILVTPTIVYDPLGSQ